MRLVAIVQTPAQLRAAYGEGAEEIIANCGAKLFFAPASSRDARELSDMLGSYGLEVASRTRPLGLSGGRRTESRAEQRRPLLLPQELLQMDRDHIVVVPRGLPPVRGRRLLWRQVPAFMRRWREAPYLQPRSAASAEAPPPAATAKAEKANLALQRMRAQRDLFGERAR